MNKFEDAQLLTQHTSWIMEFTWLSNNFLSHFLDAIGPVDEYFGFIYATSWEIFVPACFQQSTSLLSYKIIVAQDSSQDVGGSSYRQKRKKSPVAWNRITCK